MNNEKINNTETAKKVDDLETFGEIQNPAGKIKVLYIAAGKAPIVKYVSPELDALQKEVEGYIECVYPYDDPVCLIVNEEGKLNTMDLNRGLKDETGCIYDIVAGPFLIAGITDDNFCSLSDEYIAKYTEIFKYPEIFAKIDGRIHCLPVKFAS